MGQWRVKQARLFLGLRLIRKETESPQIIAMRLNAVQRSELESGILKCVRSGNGISRVQVARVLGLAPSTIGTYVDRLIEDGFVLEVAPAERTGGRPPRILQTNPNGGQFIGVDFEASHIMATAVDFADRPLRSDRMLIEKGDTVEKIIAKIEQIIEQVLPSDPAALLAIGVGVPGIVNAAEGIAVQYNYIPNWQNVPLAARLSTRFRVPVYLENNARSMALAELWFGQGRSVQNFICIGVRSGIGVGIVLDGQLRRGGQGASGELGRWRCPEVRGRMASYILGGQNTKNSSTLELQDVASVRAIPLALGRALQAGEQSVLKPRPQVITIHDVVQAIQQGDRMTIAVVEEAARVLGEAVADLSFALNPSKIILSGLVTLLGDVFCKRVNETVNSKLAPLGLSTEVVNSTMGEFCGALGAAALALHEWTPAMSPQSARRRGKGHKRMP